MRKDLWKRTLRLLDLPEDMDARVPRITETEVLLLTGCGVLSVAGEGLLVKELGESRALIVGRLMRWAYGE